MDDMLTRKKDNYGNLQRNDNTTRTTTKQKHVHEGATTLSAKDLFAEIMPVRLLS